jgi:hypothetical protein
MFLASILMYLKPSVASFVHYTTKCTAAAKGGRWAGPVKIIGALRQAASSLLFVLNKWHGRVSIDSVFNRTVDCTVVVDAGLRGTDVVWGRGGWCPESQSFFAAPWPQRVLDLAMREQKYSSTFVEVFNALTAVQTLATPGSRVRIVTDSQPGYFAITKLYSKCPFIVMILKALTLYCLLNDIVIAEVKWVPREENVPADLLSHGDIQEFRDAVPDGRRYSRVTPYDTRLQN